MSAAGITAVSCVALTNVVLRLAPFLSTTVLASNPDPFTVNMNEAPPAAALLGAKVVIAGGTADTVTDDVRDASLPAASRAVQVTDVVPTGKFAGPAGMVQFTVGVLTASV